ncbi:semaphorin-4F-like isoform X1 [Myxocyprinus asiaticus]|uniref:semaphorin-4F-like isoform X1 n=1 Tax=Myxocyprinus asiaticus TaxID=70543 RepID=UPI0022213EA2|nr:semaphorin-4F-like isoform X1 [Myxocyprinus asiaticus]XP_051554231.1 semaphorin-4F-like isoform X1 [Myxocyprinus asiaticus]
MKSVTSLFVLSVLLCSTTVSWSATINSRGVGISKVGSHEFGGIYNFSTFLLDRESGILYLGARDAVIAVDTTNLSKRKTIEWSVPEEKRKSCVAKGKTEDDCKNYVRLLEFLGDRRIYACGTFAFDPQCAFINISSFSLETNEDGSVKMETGKGKCPFEPSQHYTAVMAGGILYTAATSNFLGTMYDISRATGMEQERIRTEQSINWLSDPEFVSSAFIQEDEENNPTGEDDKIYFFFTEVAKEYDLYTKVKVPRVARVCKSDVGGMKTLQRRWTTFLKAQLVCEDRASGQRFNVLTDVFTVQHQPGDPSSTHFYGIFTSQWEREELSAVCVYSLEEITKVMNGPFKELKKSCENWINPEPIPTPRPGQCLNNALKQQGFESSLKLPDKVLTFMRDHPLMENSVVAAPLMIRNGITYTKLAVTLTTASNGSKQQMVTVLHLGTDRGQLHKVAVVGPNATLIEEVSLFSAQEPVNNILLYKDKALVGSPLSLVKLPIVGCSFYTTCEVCARAHGLGCVWSHKDGACAMAKPGKVVEPEDLANQCNKEGLCSPPVIEMRVEQGLRVLLSCVQVSPRPCRWDHPPQSHTRLHNYDLEVQVTPESLGTYVCLCDEVGRDQPPCRRAEYQLTLETPRIEGNVAIAGGRHFLVSHIILFVVGFIMGAFILFLVYKHQGGLRGGGHSSSTLEKGRDLLPSTDTPQSPSSASLLSEAVPLTEKRNGTINGHSGHIVHTGGHNGRHIYANSCGLKLQESAVNLADELDGREMVGPKGEEDGLGEVLSEMEEEFAKLSCLRGAPLAQCEESSI